MTTTRSRKACLALALAGATALAGCASMFSAPPKRTMGPRVDVEPPRSVTAELSQMSGPILLGAGDGLGDRIFTAYVAQKQREARRATASAPVDVH